MKMLKLLRVIAVLGAYGALAAVLYKRVQPAAASNTPGSSAPSPTIEV